MKRPKLKRQIACKYPVNKELCLCHKRQLHKPVVPTSKNEMSFYSARASPKVNNPALLIQENLTEPIEIPKVLLSKFLHSDILASRK